MSYSVKEIAQILGGEVLGDPEIKINGFASADSAREGNVTFAENEKFFEQAQQSGASAIVVDKEFKSEKKTLIRVKNARVAFARLLQLFYPEPEYKGGVHPTAIVAPTAKVDPTAYIGPYCVICDNVEIGAKVVLLAHIYVGQSSQIGEETRIFPNVTIYHGSRIGKRVRIHSGTVIGADGFGYVFDSGRHLKVMQIGNVIIEDDVELGANVTVDRGALGPTIVGRGTKVDNLVQIAHNVVIGENCLLVAQVGIAGSTKIGNNVTLAGQVGIAGHLTVGDGAVLAAKSGLMHNVPPGEKWMGIPAQPDKQMKRIFISMQRLPELLSRVNELEKKLEALTNNNSEQNKK